MALLPAPLYIGVALVVDRFEPDPLGMIALTFLSGAALATLIAYLLALLGDAVLGGSLDPAAGQVFESSMAGPVVEEVAKGLVLYGIYRRHRDEFTGVVDGIVYGATVALGFATVQNVLLYGAMEASADGAASLFVVRGLVSPFADPLFTAMTGAGLGIAARSRTRTASS